MKALFQLLINSIAVYAAAAILPGIHLTNFVTAILVVIVLGVVNTLLKPILLILTLPITILSLGLFVLVINTLMILLTAALLPGFDVANFWWGLLFGIVLTLFRGFLQSLEKDNPKDHEQR